MARVAFVIGDYPSEERSRREKVALSYATARWRSASCPRRSPPTSTA